MAADHDGLLDAIDHALHDYETSLDAMRWAPEPPLPKRPTRWVRIRYGAKQKLRFWFSRWTIANLLNHLKRTCWCTLVDWVLYEKDGSDEDQHHKLRYAVSGGDYCRERTANPPTKWERNCYCGKFTDGCLTPKNWTPDEEVTDADL